MSSLRHRPGDLIDGRYEMRKVLGSGAFGTVYLCRDAELDITVAVKELHVLDEAGGERETALGQFRAEAIHLSKLRHPHIVSGHYEPQNGSWRVCPIDGLDFPQLRACPDHNAPLLELTSRHYLVMEYIAGPDLLQLSAQRGGALKIDEAIASALDIAGALAFLHERGFVHRDIKPENIRLREADSQAVLLDFGITTQGETVGDRYGTRVKRGTQGGGTQGYAPTSRDEQRAPDARSDIHAFGMTWFHLLTGIDPTDPLEERKMRAHAPRKFRAEIPPALSELIVDCIEFEPSKRPQNGAALLARLKHLKERPLAPAAAPAPTDKAPQTARRRNAPAPAPFQRRHPRRFWCFVRATRFATWRS
jgi:serine/threonine protein kinase